MKKTLMLACLLTAVLISPVIQAAEDTLTILHVNDTHSHLLPYGPKDANGDWTWGGMARLATLVGMDRLTEPNVMLFHSGDFSVGDFMFQEYLGIPELEIMKALGYDALELGNHEFDLYSSTLKFELNQAAFPSSGFPVLCANLNYTADPEMGAFVQPYIVKDIGAVKIGIFGLLTDFTNQASNPAPDTVLPPLSVAQKWVDSLRQKLGCNMVILLSHLGSDMDQMVAMSTTGIDVIVGGHSHTVLATPLTVGSTMILQAGEFGRYLGKLRLIVENGQIKSWGYELQSVDSSVPAEPNLAGMLAGLAAGVEADPRFGPVFTDVLAQNQTDLDSKLGSGVCKDNPLGNLIADAFRDKTGTDITFYPQGFISQKMWAGDVKGDDIWQSVPYGFDQISGLGLKLATLRTDGMSLMAGLEFAVYNLPYVEDFFLHCSNITYAYNSANQPGSRVNYASILINGAPINPAGSYTVTVPDAVVPFLSQISGFQINDLTITDDFVYTVVKDYMVAHSPVIAFTEGRVLDLAVFANPMAAIASLHVVISLFQQDGFITKDQSVRLWEHELELVEKHLDSGRNQAAMAILGAISEQAEDGVLDGSITATAAQRLTFLIDQLVAAIRASAVARGVQEEVGILPGKFALAQNSPNPFNPETRITYSLLQPSAVNLTVYNLLGQTVKVLVNDNQTAGEHSVIWDGHNRAGEQVASGIYFYRLKAGNFIDTRRMSLIR